MPVSEKDIARIESDVSTLKTDVMALKTQGAVERERHTVVLGRLDKIDGHISWILRLIVGGIVMAILGYALRGGFNAGA